MRGLARTASLCAAILLTNPGTAPAAGTAAPLRSKAVELGLDGSIISVEGVSSAIVGVSVGQYRYAGTLPLRYALGLAYHRVSDADGLDLEGSLTLLQRISDSRTYVFGAVAGGLRQEWIGSFSHDRYALGVDLGFKMLSGTSAAGTVTYQFRHMFNDPVSNFNEHRFVFGISILFRNAPEPGGDG